MSEGQCRRGGSKTGGPLYLKTLEIQKRLLGEEHPSTLWTMNNLATLYGQQGRPAGYQVR